MMFNKGQRVRVANWKGQIAGEYSPYTYKVIPDGAADYKLVASSAITLEGETPNGS